MKKSIHYLLILCTVMLTSCNLFIDEDLERQLLEYSGKGYDKVESETTENYSIEYKYKNTTLELNADNPLTRHILRVENNEAARCHIIHFDSSVSVDEIPRVGQCIVSNNQELFPYGLCDMVGVVESENGEHILTCKGVDVNEAFDYLNFHASVPLENPFDEYNMYDEEGNLLFHVDNREENARMQTRGSNGDDYFNVNIPFDIPWSDTRLTNLRKKFYSDTFKLTITGGLKGKLYTECDYSSDEGLKAGLRFKDGSIDIGIKLEVILGQSGMQKIFGNDDLLNGKVRVSVGPVVIVPVFGFSINIQVWDAITTEVKYHKPLDFELGFKDGDFYSNDNSGDGTITTSFEVSGNFHFPVVKLSLGFGLYTSDLSIRFETFFRLATKISAISGSKTYNPSGDETGPVDISLNPKVTTDFQIGFAVALVAKGMIIGKIVEKIKEHVKECSTLNEAMESYVGNGTFMDWIKFQEGKTDGIDPSVLAAMNRIVGGLEGDKRKDAINAIIKARSQEVSNIKPLSDQAVNTLNTGHIVKPGEGEKNKEYALRLGPFYPDLLKWPLVSRYLLPKIADGSFRVGRNWDANKEKLIFTAEFAIEDPGLMSLIYDFYPSFLIKHGNEGILSEMANNGEKLKWDTPKGKRFSASFPGLAADMVYTCVPCYSFAVGAGVKYFDKGLSFSTTTPSINIANLTVTKNERNEQYDANNNPIGVTYNYAFDTYTQVIGSRNVSEWGIIDLNDTNEKTRIHTSKKASLKSGQYIHHWSIKNTKKSKVTISLQPYLFAKDGNKNDWSEAKFFPRYDAVIKDEYDFSAPMKLPNDNFGGFGSAKVELDSVTCDGVRVL